MLAYLELFGNNLEGKQVSITIVNGSQAGLVDQINSFSESNRNNSLFGWQLRCGVTAY